jgi:signal transduction histidine kinase
MEDSLQNNGPKALTPANNPLDRFDTKALEKILSVVRHEIGNTVNAALIILEVLRKEMNATHNSKRDDYLNRLEMVLAKQRKLVMALKSYAKISAAEIQKISIHDFWQQLLATTRLLSGHDRIRFVNHIPPETVQIMVNMNSLMFIMKSFLNNAFEASENAHEQRIQIDCFQHHHHCIIQVQDNGHGIDADAYQDIFLPLYSTKPEHDGMGLSLALKLALEMQGKIRVNSKPDAGACFQLQLNCADETTAG